MLSGRNRVALIVAVVLAALPSAAVASPGWAGPGAELASPGGSQLTPHLASDPQGDTAVAWSDAGGNVFVSERPAGGSFSVGTQVSTATGQQFGSIAMDGSGLIYVFFATGTGSNSTSQTQVATKPIGGSTWTVTPLQAINASDPPQMPLYGAVTAAGKGVAVWKQGHAANDTASILVFATKAAGSSAWSAPAAVPGSQGALGADAVALNAGGDAALVFTKRDPTIGGNFFPFGATMPDGGAWTTANEIATRSGSNNPSVPVVGIDDAGQATAAWTLTDSSNNNPVVQFATKASLADASWPQAPAAGGANDLSAAGAAPPSIGVAPDGTTTIGWTRSSVVEERTRAAGGSSFGALDTLTNALSFPNSAVVVAAPDGAMTVLWSGQSGGGASLISGAHRAAGSSSFSATPDAPGTGNASPAAASDGLGNVAVAWIGSPSAFQFVDEATGLAIAPPTIGGVLFPATGIAAVAFPFGATLTDRWTTATGHWTFGDGSSSAALSGMKTYAAAGTFHAALTASDPFGNTATVGRTILVGTSGGGGGSGVGRPTLSALAETNAVFAVGRASTPLTGSAAAARRHKRGTVFSFRLDRAATVRIAIQVAARGRLVGRSCKPDSRRLRHRRRCTRLVTVVTLVRSGHKGLDKVAFSGRVHRKALKPRRYRARFVAVNRAGASRAKAIAFTIVRR